MLCAVTRLAIAGAFCVHPFPMTHSSLPQSRTFDMTPCSDQSGETMAENGAITTLTELNEGQTDSSITSAA